MGRNSGRSLNPVEAYRKKQKKKEHRKKKREPTYEEDSDKEKKFIDHLLLTNNPRKIKEQLDHLRRKEKEGTLKKSEKKELEKYERLWLRIKEELKKHFHLDTNQNNNTTNKQEEITKPYIKDNDNNEDDIGSSKGSNAKIEDSENSISEKEVSEDKLSSEHSTSKEQDEEQTENDTDDQNNVNRKKQSSEVEEEDCFLETLPSLPKGLPKELIKMLEEVKSGTKQNSHVIHNGTEIEETSSDPVLNKSVIQGHEKEVENKIEENKSNTNSNKTIHIENIQEENPNEISKDLKIKEGNEQTSQISYPVETQNEINPRSNLSIEQTNWINYVNYMNAYYNNQGYYNNSNNNNNNNNNNGYPGNSYYYYNYTVNHNNPGIINSNINSSSNNSNNIENQNTTHNTEENLLQKRLINIPTDHTNVNYSNTNYNYRGKHVDEIKHGFNNSNNNENCSQIRKKTNVYHTNKTYINAAKPNWGISNEQNNPHNIVQKINYSNNVSYTNKKHTLKQRNLNNKQENKRESINQEKKDIYFVPINLRVKNNLKDACETTFDDINSEKSSTGINNKKKKNTDKMNSHLENEFEKFMKEVDFK